MRYSVVIPVLDEEKCIVPVLEELRAIALEPAPLEIIVVDDGSHDATAAHVATLLARDSRLVLVRHRHNCGKSAAIRSGVRAARGEWIATIDGDGQNDPRDVARLLAAAEGAGAHGVLVAGVREVRDDRLARRLASRVANAVRHGVLGDGCPDTACGLKLFPREAFLALPFFEGMHRFLPALFRAYGHDVQTVAVSGRARLGGRSKYGYMSRAVAGVVDMLGVFWLRRRARPVIGDR